MSATLSVGILHLLGNETQWLPSLSAGAANFVQEAEAMSCQGHLVRIDPMFSTGGAKALGNW